MTCVGLLAVEVGRGGGGKTDVEVLGIDLLVLGEVEVLLGHEDALAEEVLVDELAVGLGNEPAHDGISHLRFLLSPLQLLRPDPAPGSFIFLLLFLRVPGQIQLYHPHPLHSASDKPSNLPRNEWSKDVHDCETSGIVGRA